MAIGVIPAAKACKEAQPLRARAGERCIDSGLLLNSTVMANEQSGQQRNTNMKLGVWIQLCVVILGLLKVGAASACSCGQVGVENLVLDKRLSLAKIVVMPPSFKERVESLLDLFKAERTYAVKVVEVITGRYDATAIKVRSSGSTDCGVDLRHGETYYHRASPSAEGGDTYASGCNLVDEEYVRQVKAYKRRPKPELSPVTPGSWTEISGVPSRLCMLITAASQAIRTVITSGFSEIWPTIVASSRKRRSYRSPARSGSTT